MFQLSQAAFALWADLLPQTRQTSLHFESSSGKFLSSHFTRRQHGLLCPSHSATQNGASYGSQNLYCQLREGLCYQDPYFFQKFERRIIKRSI